MREKEDKIKKRKKKEITLFRERKRVEIIPMIEVGPTAPNELGPTTQKETCVCVRAVTVVFMW